MSKAKKTGSKDAERKAKAPVNAGEKSLTIEGVTVPVSHLDKVYYPGEGITKGDVIQYYLSMADYLMKYLKGRPLSLFRNPGGIGEPGFFQKDVDGNLPSFAASYEMEAASTGKIVHYFVCNNLASLVYLNNLGCIEINPWHSTVNSPDRPDYLIIDIDPSVNNTFEQVMETALTIREVLDHAGAP
ncbi:MAG: ATP-dependent DNA ligase, partial [Bacteroidota bacterium]|nr:ATP-dependent DNA ligase [Bacteroidota bacterium]